MAALRNDALRLALYLDCIGIEPRFAGRSYKDYVSCLTRQYQSIETSLRKAARRLGRKAIHEANGLEAAAAHLVPLPQPHPPGRKS